MTTIAPVDRYLRFVAEMTSQRASSDPPGYEMRDHLIARLYRDVPGISRADEERALVAIRRGTGT